MRRSKLWVLLVCAGFALTLVTPTGAGAATAPELSVLGAPLTVSGSKGEDTAKAYLSLLNSGSVEVPISVTFQATSSDRVTVQSISPPTVPPGAARRIEVVLGGLEDLGEAATGQLVVSGGAAPVAQSIEVDPPAPDTVLPLVVVLGSLAFALFLALAVAGNMTSRSSLSNPAPGPKWSFSSWATTLTGAGAVFGTVLGQATLPTFPELVSKSELVNLNIFFGVLAVVGPFLFEGLRKTKPAPADAKAGRMGTNLTLLISCSFTLWAVSGQLGAFGLLGWELLGGKGVAVLALAAVLLVAGLAGRYFFLTTSEMVERDWVAEEAAAIPPVPPGGERFEFDVADYQSIGLRFGHLGLGPVMIEAEEQASVEIAVPAATATATAAAPVVTQAPPSWALL